MIEANDKSMAERLSRVTRVRKVTPDASKLSQATESGLKHDADNDPTKTSRGKHSVNRQAARNKKHPNRFAESVEFICLYRNKPISECLQAIDNIADRRSLGLLVTRLLYEPGQNRDWLSQIKRHLEHSGGRYI